MDRNQEPDPVLRALGEDLARDDPRLAALLGEPARRSHRGRRLALLVLLPVLVTLALLVPPTVALGTTALLLAAGSPVAVCWLCAQDPPGHGVH